MKVIICIFTLLLVSCAGISVFEKYQVPKEVYEKMQNVLIIDVGITNGFIDHDDFAFSLNTPCDQMFNRPMTDEVPLESLSKVKFVPEVVNLPKELRGLKRWHVNTYRKGKGPLFILVPEAHFYSMNTDLKKTTYFENEWEYANVVRDFIGKQNEGRDFL